VTRGVADVYERSGDGKNDTQCSERGVLVRLAEISRTIDRDHERAYVNAAFRKEGGRVRMDPIGTETVSGWSI
jgi:hypothetical protein